jgi:hypothetical protein
MTLPPDLKGRQINPKCGKIKPKMRGARPAQTPPGGLSNIDERRVMFDPTAKDIRR